MPGEPTSLYTGIICGKDSSLSELLRSLIEDRARSRKASGSRVSLVLSAIRYYSRMRELATRAARPSHVLVVE